MQTSLTFLQLSLTAALPFSSEPFLWLLFLPSLPAPIQEATRDAECKQIRMQTKQNAGDSWLFGGEGSLQSIYLSSYTLHFRVKCFTEYWDEQKKHVTLEDSWLKRLHDCPENTSPFLCTRLGRLLKCTDPYRGFKCKESLERYCLNRSVDKLLAIK